MEIPTTLFRPTTLKFEKNDVPPPNTVISVIDSNTEDLIRQIPSDGKKSVDPFAENLPPKHLIDFYV